MATSEQPIRVIVVDDHPMMRNGIKAYLAIAGTVECVGEAASGEEAVTLCKELQPRVVLMDLAMPGMGGVAATQTIRRECPETRVVALTSFGDPALVQEAVRGGAFSYLLKNVSGAALVDAHCSLPPAANRPWPPKRSTPSWKLRPTRPRQAATYRSCREVLQLVAKGMTNFQIAHQIGISEATVRFHVGHILSKLELGTAPSRRGRSRTGWSSEGWCVLHSDS